MSITIREIAKLANVSIGTVSRVLNNKETGYTEETKAKVLDVVKRYDYIPNSAARALSTQSTKTLGIASSCMQASNKIIGLLTF